MQLPLIHIEDIDIKLSIGQCMLNVLFVRSGYFKGSVPRHSHSLGSYEIHYIPCGQGTLITSDRQYQVQPGTLYVTGPDVAHEQIPHPLDPMAESCIFFELLPREASTTANQAVARQDALLSELLLSTPFWIGQDTEQLMGLFALLAEEVAAARLGYHTNVTRLLEIIITRVLRQYPSSQPTLPPAPLKTLDDKRLLTIERCFLHQYATITLKLLAEQLGLSIRQTERAVYKQYGLTFTDKKLQARMGAAARLLTSTDLSVTQVAAQVGFATLAQFSRTFKTFYGLSATQYRAGQQISAEHYD